MHLVCKCQHIFANFVSLFAENCYSLTWKVGCGMLDWWEDDVFDGDYDEDFPIAEWL